MKTYNVTVKHILYITVVDGSYLQRMPGDRSIPQNRRHQLVCCCPL